MCPKTPCVQPFLNPENRLQIQPRVQAPGSFRPACGNDGPSAFAAKKWLSGGARLD
jgi:hypothetical protein